MRSSWRLRGGVFPLYEVFDGLDYRINAEPDGTDPAEYFVKQRRFSGKDIDFEAVKRKVQETQSHLRGLASL